MGEYIPFFIDHGFDAAIRQHQSPNFSGHYDREAPLQTLKTPPNFPGDGEGNINDPWWIPNINTIVLQLQGAEIVLESLVPMTAPPYPINPPEVPTDDAVAADENVIEDEGGDYSHHSDKETINSPPS